MTAVSWDRVKAIFQQALEGERTERAALVRDRCGDDRALQAEVLSLLAAHDAAGSFAERAAIETCDETAFRAVRAIDEVKRSVEGRTIGPYRLQVRIGVGGMGDVYRARDTKLERDVAIKMLPSHFAADPDRLARLEREARLLASLNHPHICAIYGIE